MSLRFLPPTLKHIKSFCVIRLCLETAKRGFSNIGFKTLKSPESLLEDEALKHYCFHIDVETSFFF